METIVWSLCQYPAFVQHWAHETVHKLSSMLTLSLPWCTLSGMRSLVLGFVPISTLSLVTSLIMASDMFYALRFTLCNDLDYLLSYGLVFACLSCSTNKPNL